MSELSALIGYGGIIGSANFQAGSNNSVIQVGKTLNPETSPSPQLRSRQFGVPHEAPYGWIQWKGTNVCIDIECACGAHLHHDGDFMYHVQCGRCKQIYECDGFIKLHPIPTEEFEQGRDSVCPVVVLDEGD